MGEGAGGGGGGGGTPSLLAFARIISYSEFAGHPLGSTTTNRFDLLFTRIKIKFVLIRVNNLFFIS
jgi:hypothetical protein